MSKINTMLGDKPAIYAAILAGFLASGTAIYSISDQNIEFWILLPFLLMFYLAMVFWPLNVNANIKWVGSSTSPIRTVVAMAIIFALWGAVVGLGYDHIRGVDSMKVLLIVLPAQNLAFLFRRWRYRRRAESAPKDDL